MRRFICTLTLFWVGLVGSAAKAERPWRPRRPPTPPPAAHQLVDVSRWPEEPPPPEQVMPDRFGQAVAYLCRLPIDQTPAYEILAAAREAQVDPFLLAALMSERSRCKEKAKGRGGYGLLMIQPAMYLSKSAPNLSVHADEWRTANLLSARSNASLGARLLRMWQEQHDALDLAFGGVPHRSAVSHFYWGDEVGSSGSEDLVLTARRRLLQRYQGKVDEPRSTTLGVALVPPLEAAPRVATSGPGADRDQGARRHQGLDIAATPGEPIRAVADGKVIFAGVALVGNLKYGPIPPSKIARYVSQANGRGGIYLCIRHDAAEESTRLVTCYMHLERYFVASGEQVRAGQTIALVGRTGVKHSPPHLHFEVRLDNKFQDPWQLYTDSIIPPVDTLTYRYAQRAQRARVRAARASRIPTATINVSPKF